MRHYLDALQLQHQTQKQQDQILRIKEQQEQQQQQLADEINRAVMLQRMQQVGRSAAPIGMVSRTNRKKNKSNQTKPKKSLCKIPLLQSRTSTVDAETFFFID